MKKLLSLFVLLVAIVTGAQGAASTTSDGKYASGTVDFSTIGTLSATTTYWNNGVKFYSGNSTTVSSGNDKWGESVTIPSYVSDVTFGKDANKGKWGSNGSGKLYTSSGFVCSQHTIGVHVNSACTITVIVNKNIGEDTDNAGITASIDATSYATAWTSSTYKAAGSTALTVTSSRADKTNYPGRYTLTINVTEENLTNGEAVVKMFNGSSGTGAGKLFCWESVTVTENNNPSISAENVNIAKDATSEGEISFSVSNPVAGGAVTAATEADWLTPGEVDNTNGKVPFSATANTGAPRNATVTLTYTYTDGTEKTVTKDVTVSQAAPTYAITYSPGAYGTGSIEAGEKSYGVDFTLTSSTFSRDEYVQTGWATSDGGEKVYDLGGTYTANVAIELFPVWEAHATKGTSIIKATLTSNTTATVTGSIGGTADVKVATTKDDSDGYKFGGKDQYFGLLLATGYNFKEGDIINVHTTTTAQQGTIAIYDADKSTILYNTGVYKTSGTDGTLEDIDNKFVLPAAVNGKSKIYICRTEANNWNGFVKYVEVTRPNATITLNASGFATYSAATDFEFAGAKAYKMALNESAGTIAGTEVTGAIAAGEGILFKGEAGATVAITETTGAEAFTDNDLKGTTTASGKATVPTYCYTLSGNTFKKFKGTTFNDNKAYLESTKDLSGQSFEIIFDDQPTAISFVVEDDANVAVAPVKVIKNGQLFIGNYNVAGARIK